MANYSLLKKMYEDKNFIIVDSFDSWEDAVRTSVKPLIDNGIVLPEYSEKVVEMVKEYGPYICICPHVAIPHAMEPSLVLSDKSHICFMKVNHTVSFSNNESEKAELFFSLAAPSGEKHLSELQNVVEFLEEENVIENLLNAKTEEDFKKLFI